MNNRIWFIKVALIGLAGLATVLLFTTGGNDDIERIQFDPAAEKRSFTSDDIQEAVGETKMMSPRYTGEDADGRSWDIQAESATHTEDENQSDIGLQAIKALLSLSTGGHIEIDAKSGHFNPITQDIALTGSVAVLGYGYTLKTEGITGNIKDREIETVGPLSMSGIGMSLLSDQLIASNHGKEIELRNIQVTIDPSLWDMKKGGFIKK